VCLAAVLVLLAGCGQEHARAGSATPRSVVTHGPTAPAGPTRSPGPTGSLSPTGSSGSPGSPGSPGPPSPTGLLRIALTFDSNMTDAMLRELNTGKVKSYANVGVIDELQRSHTPATFFLAGKWVERYPDLTRRIAADPRFELASHSYAHLAFTPRCYHLGVLPTGQMAADVEHSFAVLARFSGRQTRYFRFPGGCYNARALQAIAPAHCTVVQYDIVGDDPFNNDPTAIANNVLRNAHNGGLWCSTSPRPTPRAPPTRSPRSSPACVPADTSSSQCPNCWRRIHSEQRSSPYESSPQLTVGPLRTPRGS
jgi:hypothetical protein